jgi:hypothetical protein
MNLVWREIRGLNSLDETDLRSFRQSRAIEQRFDEVCKSIDDAKTQGLFTSPGLQLMINFICLLISDANPVVIERMRATMRKPVKRQGNWFKIGVL